MSLLFLLTSLGVVNGTFLGLYLLFKKKATVQEIFFAGLILSLCIRIGKSVFYYFNRDADLLILQLGLSACIFIGPFFYLLMKSLASKQSQMSLFDRLLLISTLISIVVIGSIYPYRSYPLIWNGYIVYGIYSVWLVFVIIGTWKAAALFRGNGLRQDDQTYLISIVASVIFITITYQLALFIGLTYLWGSLIFSFSFYYLAFRLIISKKSIIPKIPSPTSNTDISILESINALMKEQKPFLKQGMKLEDLAEVSKVSRHTLSRILNETYPFGFAHYLHSFRVEEAKTLIENKPHLSLEGIGYEAGFKSKSSFFEAFKKITKQTPAAYRQSLANTEMASK